MPQWITNCRPLRRPCAGILHRAFPNGNSPCCRPFRGRSTSAFQTSTSHRGGLSSRPVPCPRDMLVFCGCCRSPRRNGTSNGITVSKRWNSDSTMRRSCRPIRTDGRRLILERFGGGYIDTGATAIPSPCSAGDVGQPHDIEEDSAVRELRIRRRRRFRERLDFLDHQPAVVGRVAGEGDRRQIGAERAAH